MQVTGLISHSAGTLDSTHLTIWSVTEWVPSQEMYRTWKNVTHLMCQMKLECRCLISLKYQKRVIFYNNTFSQCLMPDP